MFNLKFAIRYIFHRFKAINRHGLHSPFVYRLVDKVIYDFESKKVYSQIQNEQSGRKKLSHVDKLLYRLVTDAQPSELIKATKISRTDEAILKKAIQMKAEPSVLNAKGTKLIFMDAGIAPNTVMTVFTNNLPAASDQTIVIVKNNHQNRIAEHAWQHITQHPRVTVTVDLFWIGLVYFRHGQVKENFLIKF